MYLCNLVTLTAHQVGIIIYHYKERVEFSYTSMKAVLLIKTSNAILYGSGLLREIFYSRATVISNITAE